MRRWPLDLLAIWALTLPGWLPLVTGRLIGTHDGQYHLYRFLELARAVRAGDLYPRWAPEFALGFGYPVFNYYPPLALYVALPFHLAGLGLIAAFGLGQLVAVLLGAAGAYVLVRERMGRLAGVVAGVLLGSLPYLLVDLYVRGAIAETLGLALLPWVFRATRRAAERPTPGRVAAAGLAIGALALAHNITALTGLPAALAYALIGGLGRRSLVALGSALTLGLAASAIYWAPALLERDLITHEVLTSAFYDFRNHFNPAAGVVQLTPAFEYRYDYFGGFLFKAGLAQVALAAVGAIAWWRRETWFWAALAVGGLLLQVEASSPLWESVALLSFVQFPWRLLTLVGLATVVLAAGAVRAWRWSAPIVVATWLAASLALLDPALLDLREDEVSAAALNRIELDRRLVGTTTAGEYTPRMAAADLFASWARRPELPGTAARVDLTGVARGRIDLAVTSPEGGWVAIDQRAFPTWRAVADGVERPIVPTEGHGLVAALAPPGTRTLTVENSSSGLERAAAWTSALGALALALVAVGRRASVVAAPAVLLAVAALAPGAGAAARTPELGPAAFEGGARLLGGTVDGGGELTLYWTADAPVERELTVAVRLLDDAGNVVGRRDKAPRFGLRPTTVLQPGYVVRDMQELAGPREGRYRVVVGLFDGVEGVRPLGAAVQWPDGVGVEVGTIEGRDLKPAPMPDERKPIGVASGGMGLLGFEARVGEPPRLRASAQALVERLRRRFGLGETIAGGRLGGPDGVMATLEPGSRLTLHTSWRALRDVPADHAATVQVLDHRQRLLTQDDEWPRRGFAPTSLWQPGETVDSWYSPRIPPDAAPGRYRVVLGVYPRPELKRLIWMTPGRLSEWLELGHVKVPPRPRAAPPGGPTFGGAIRLADVQVERGDVVRVRPTWVVERAPGAEYTAFVHVVDGSGQPAAQGDAPPLGGAYPTSLWEAGEVIEDEYTLPGGVTGRVLIGLYRPDTGERLRAEDGRDAAEVATLTG